MRLSGVAPSRFAQGTADHLQEPPLTIRPPRRYAPWSPGLGKAGTNGSQTHSFTFPIMFRSPKGLAPSGREVTGSGRSVGAPKFGFLRSNEGFTFAFPGTNVLPHGYAGASPSGPG